MPRRSTTTPGRRMAIGFALAAAVAACGAPSPTVVPATPAPAPTPSPAVTPSPVATAPSPSAGSSPSPTGGLAYDETLLAILPGTIAGLPVVSTPEITAELSADPTLPAIADRVAAGVVADGTRDELAVAMVVHLRPDVFEDAFFRDYRDSFDAAACAQAGGLVGNAEAQIGGRTTFIATCEGGARTYHTFVATRDTIVSVISAGEELRLGEQLMEGLQG